MRICRDVVLFLRVRTGDCPSMPPKKAVKAHQLWKKWRKNCKTFAKKRIFLLTSVFGYGIINQVVLFLASQEGGKYVIKPEKS